MKIAVIMKIAAYAKREKGIADDRIDIAKTSKIILSSWKYLLFEKQQSMCA